MPFFRSVFHSAFCWFACSSASAIRWPARRLLPSLLVLFLALGVLTPSVSASPKAFRHFKADAKRHAWSNSYLLAVASHFSYRASVRDLSGKGWKAKFNNALSPYGLDVVDFVSIRERGVDTQFIVARRRGMLVVAFAGSEGILSEGGFRDWVRTDFRARLVRPSWLTDIRIHKGFSVAVDVAYSRLLASIRKHRRPGATLWLTGHSLGGALASLAALRLHRDGVTVDGVYTYAAPHVGNKQWVEAYLPLKHRTQRWVHGLDPVTRLPPAPYKPVGITHVVRAGGKVELSSKQRKIALPLFNNHSLTGYIKHIHKAMPTSIAKKMPAPPKAAAKAERKRLRQADREERKEERNDKRAQRKREREARKAERKHERAAKKAARQER